MQHVWDPMIDNSLKSQYVRSTIGAAPRKRRDRKPAAVATILSGVLCYVTFPRRRLSGLSRAQHPIVFAFRRFISYSPLFFLTTRFTGGLTPATTIRTNPIIVWRKKSRLRILHLSNFSLPRATMADQQMAQASNTAQAVQATSDAGPSTGPITKECE